MIIYIIIIGDFEMICEYHFRMKKNGTPDYRCFCRNPELIENYDKAIADTKRVWECHHRLESHFSDGTERPINAQLSQAELVALEMYFDRSPEELIFITKAEHNKLHNIGKKFSEEHKIKIGKAMSKKVLCVETGEVFESLMDAYRKTGINQSNISQTCLGKRKTCSGYHWKFV